MTHLWRGISVILSVLVIFSLFYLYIQYEKTDQQSRGFEEPVPRDTSMINDSNRRKEYKSDNDTSAAATNQHGNATAEENVTSSEDDTADIATSKSNKSDEESTDDSVALSSSERGFVVFDGTNFRPKPTAFAEAGLEPIDIVYSTRIFAGRNNHELKNLSSTELPDKETVINEAHKAAQVNDVVVIDIEHWPLDSKKVDNSIIEHSLDNYLTVMDWFQEAIPEVDFGYYGEIPIRSYWDAIRPRSSERYQQWMRANNKLQPLANKVDVLFPSLYTFYQDQERWVEYAVGMIMEARRYNPDKPVYVFLWPEYHPYDKSVAGKKIEGEFWRLQLETARKHADGIVIWAGGNFDWNPNDAWWRVTKEFMKELKAHS